MNAILEQVRPETAAVLEERARALGVTVDEYLKNLLGVTNGKGQGTPIDEFMAEIDSLSDGTENLPPLPANFSRSDIYFDHD